MPSMSAYARLAVTAPASRLVAFDVPLETKLHAPAARDQWVKREELVGYLAGATAELILVDAPAGFGKTTLVAQWRASSRESRPFGWEHHQDPHQGHLPEARRFHPAGRHR
jgi:hypothetical protein